jgi:hypothetical protein
MSETAVMILLGIVLGAVVLGGFGCVILGLLGELRQNWIRR